MPAGGMPSMAMASMPGMAAGEPPALAWLIGMWAVMMVAMMLPSAAPTILLFASVSRRRRQEGRPAVPVAVFTLGYLLVWTVYAAAAGSAQWELHRLALLSPAMASASPLLAGGTADRGGRLSAAADQGRVPLALPLAVQLLLHRMARGRSAARWRWVSHHGTFCVGCCWLLMALLFVAGVMNLLWVAAIAGFVLLEKLVRGGAVLGRVAGVALICWGVWVLSA